MNLKNICRKTEYTCLQGSLDIDITDITWDSGAVSQGSMFVCISGSLKDGHTYIPLAVSKKASVIVIENDAFARQIPKNITILQVPCSRYALALMSAAFFAYPDQRLTTIGITGTKGKTTVSYMIKSILESAGKKVGLVGTTGTIIGEVTRPSQNTTPESYRLHSNLAEMVSLGCDYAIVEVSSQGLKLHRTAGIVFDYGIFTNLSADHIGPLEHASMEEYIRCKGLLFRQCRSAVVNMDDEHMAEVIQGHTCELNGFSLCPDKSTNHPPALGRKKTYPILSALHHDIPLMTKNMISADNVEFIKENGRLGMSFDAKGALRCSAKIYIPGRFSVYNALAAMSTCHLVGISPESILTGLEKAQIRGRVEMLPVPGDYTLIIDFAHNEVSVRSILETLLEYRPKRLICLYGCGGDRSRQRRYDMGEVTGKLADLSVLTCDNPRSESLRSINDDIKKGLARSKGSYIEIDDRKKAITYCIKNARPGDMIVLLGKGHENYQEINGFKYHFDEREVLEDILKSL